jgi:hypothetical protein
VEEAADPTLWCAKLSDRRTFKVQSHHNPVPRKTQERIQGQTKMRQEHQLLAGDRVRLTPTIAENLMRNNRNRVDWLARGCNSRVRARGQRDRQMGRPLTIDFWPEKASVIKSSIERPVKALGQGRQAPRI